MTDTTSELIFKGIETAERTGKLDKLEIEFWKGGGLPPPNYKSDQLRLMTTKGDEVIEFASLKWDSSFDPPNLQEKWVMPLRPSETREVARLLLATHTLTARYAEENNPGIADIFSYEILLTAGDRQEKRTYYRTLPKELSPIRDIFDRLITLVKSQGKHSLYHQGKEVSR